MAMTAEQLAQLRVLTERAISDGWGYDRDEFYEVLTPEMTLALLNDLGAKDITLSARDYHFDQQADRIEYLEKRIAELEARHTKLRESMAAIHNTIRLDGVGTSLSGLLSASKRAWEESAPNAGINLTVEG
ncbi:hypothetical protein [Atlantibacter hermannii]|uniref:hypothetical protein n=1 Tax=Atlantibacter hermannii TaxID=565 RepID=UPI002897BBBE|nr:hypothetical protein [Atlantibacter hermannii]